jgi:hypothetical protein
MRRQNLAAFMENVVQFVAVERKFSLALMTTSTSANRPSKEEMPQQVNNKETKPIPAAFFMHQLGIDSYTHRGINE